MANRYQEALDALAFARSIIQPDWENGDGENPPIREWCKTVDALISGPAAAPDGWEKELLDWVTACQSAYHIDNTPGHRFGGLGSNLEENRSALIEYVGGLLPCTQNRSQDADWKDAEIKSLRAKLTEANKARANDALQMGGVVSSLRQQQGRLLSALEDAVSVAQAAHQHWAKGEDDKAAKYMMALAGELPGYDGRSDNVHKTGAEFSASEEADHA